MTHLTASKRITIKQPQKLAAFRTATLAILALLAAGALSGCLVAGYSSRGGFFVWPGSIVITLIVLFVLFLLRRGR